MKFWRKSMILTKKSAVIILLLSILIMFLTYLVTQSRVMEIELDDFETSIQDDTKENLVSAKNLLDGMVKDLENTAAQILKYDNLESREVRAVLEFSHKMNIFDVTFVADIEGNAYDDSGHKFNVANEEYFFKTVQQGRVVFSEVLPSEHFGAIQIISYPLFSNTHEQKGVLFGLFAVETFSDLINAVVDDKKNIYIVDSNGTYINCFNENHVEIDHGNFWEELNNRELKNISITKLKEDFHTGKEGGFSFYDPKSDMKRYGYHMPLGIQDWQIVLTVEDTIVNSHIRSIHQVDTVDLFIDAICLTAMLLCLYSYFKRTNREIITVNQEISKHNKMLQMAVNHTNNIIFEYDINKKEIELKAEIPNSPFDSLTISPVPDCILTKNIVLDESVAELKQLFVMIENMKSVQVDIQVFNFEHEKVWYRVRMNNLYNEKGEIIGTIGSAEDINNLKKGEAAIKRRDEIYKTFSANALLHGRINLSAALVTELNGTETQIPYQNYLKKIINENVCKEHQSYVAQSLSLEMLRNDYQQGKEFIEVQFLINTEEATKWVSCLVHRVHMSTSAKVTFIIRDIDEQKRREIALKEQAEHDGLTGLYNAVTVRTKINEVLSNNRKMHGVHLFILFDLDNFKQINDSFGHVYGDQVLIDVAHILKEHFRSSDFIGRLGGDEFVVMLFDVQSDRYIEGLMEKLKIAVTRNYSQGGLTVKLSASMGVVLVKNNASTFEELYQKADKALYQVKKEGKNGYKRID